MEEKMEVLDVIAWLEENDEILKANGKTNED